MQLVELRVRDLGVIDDVTIELEPGMTALTGETGAGKTLLVDALSLLLGSRADPAMVRSGAPEAVVEARFVDVSGTDQGETAEVVLSRSVATAGRSRALVDGRMVTAATLGERAQQLLELHGQHQHRVLVTASTQRLALDTYGGVDRAPLEDCHHRLTRLSAEVDRLGGDTQERARQADFLRYQLDEIGKAAIVDAGEDERLTVQEERLAAATDLRRAAAEAVGVLSDLEDESALDRLAQASGALAGFAPLADHESRLRAQMGDVADLVADLRTVVDTWEDDPAALAAVRERRQLFFELQRKYGPQLSDVVAYAEDVQRRLDAMGEEERRVAELEAEISEAREQLASLEQQVADARRHAAPELAADVEARLRLLAMPDAAFAVVVAGAGPADEVTFLLGPNRGEPPLPLARAASGGELSRAMLALRLAISTGPPVMVFDEVDAGVGGAAAATVGAALADLGRVRQVLVVTHLAQVAAQADHHVGVRKHERGGRTRSEVTVLDAEERIVELSRMLSGRPESSAARRHARELLDSGRAPR